MPRPGTITAEALERMSEPEHAELTRGRIIALTPPGWEHGLIAARLAARLLRFAEREALGQVLVETGFVLARDPDTVRAPDVSFLRAERVRTLRDPRSYVEGAPDLAIELRSPNDRPGEVRAKVLEYLDAGCALVWVVDPSSRSVSVHAPGRPVRLRSEDERLEGEHVLPGLTMPVSTLLRGAISR